MINEIINSINAFFTNVRPWVMVTPWEQALRVRFGKYTKILHAGFHIRIPVFDQFHIQSIRTRISTLERQTVTTKDNKIVTLSAQIEYSIENIEKLYRTLHHAEDTIRNAIKFNIADYIFSKDFLECIPSEICSSVLNSTDFRKYGILLTGISITDFAFTQTYRFIGDYGAGQAGSLLVTESRNFNI